MLQLSSLLTADPDTAVLLVGWGHGSGGSHFPGGTKTYFILQLLSKLSLLQIHFIIIKRLPTPGTWAWRWRGW